MERGFPLTGLTPIGEYNLLNFANINFVDTDPDFDGNHLGLAPHTYPYAATFGAGTSSLTGQTPLISIDYIESTLSSFTPRSFWYGCVLPSPYTAGSLPVSCNITATGYSQAGEQLASQTFAFMTNGSVIQDQNFGTFKGFNNIYSLGFSVSNPVAAAALIDNLIATLEQQSAGRTILVVTTMARSRKTRLDIFVTRFLWQLHMQMIVLRQRIAQHCIDCRE